MEFHSPSVNLSGECMALHCHTTESVLNRSSGLNFPKNKSHLHVEQATVKSLIL